jgi:hypothetical protein
MGILRKLNTPRAKLIAAVVAAIVVYVAFVELAVQLIALSN